MPAKADSKKKAGTAAAKPTTASATAKPAAKPAAKTQAKSPAKSAAKSAPKSAQKTAQKSSQTVAKSSSKSSQKGKKKAVAKGKPKTSAPKGIVKKQTTASKKSKKQVKVQISKKGSKGAKDVTKHRVNDPKRLEERRALKRKNRILDHKLKKAAKLRQAPLREQKLKEKKRAEKLLRAKAIALAIQKGTYKHKKRIRTSVTFHRPKTLRLKRHPKYQRKSHPSDPKIDSYQVIRYPINTDTAMKKLDDGTNSLAFIVDLRSNKHHIKAAVRKLYKATPVRINTLVQPDGRKKAYIKFAGSAVDLANQIGLC